MPNSESSLESVAQAFPQTFANKNIEQIVSFFAEDSVAMYPGYPLPANGKDENRVVWTKYFNSFDAHPVSTDSVIVASSGEIGYSTGRWASGEVASEGVLAGRYIAVWSYENRQWKIVIISAHVHEDIQPFSFSA